MTNRLVKVIRDYITIGETVSSESEVRRIFEELGIDELGLDEMDRKLLQHMDESFAG